MKRSPLRSVPTNVITGFLGAGKTTAVLSLLRQKPADERWAVLVNEFGEIGVDRSLFEGQAGSGADVAIAEVPGGCMCCAAGLPLQVALNQLLRRARPDRLLVEPTGLGHPREVLEMLSGGYYRDVLSLQRTATLVDARVLSDERYTSHKSFQQQIAVADLVVANKADLYDEQDRARFATYVSQQCDERVESLVAQHGEIPLAHLDRSSGAVFPSRESHTKGTVPELASQRPFPPEGVVSATNRGEGFESVGWRFAPDWVFDRTRLRASLGQVNVERIKGVFITGDGCFAYNSSGDGLSETPIEACKESRIELIADRIDPEFGEQLARCATSRSGQSE